MSILLYMLYIEYVVCEVLYSQVSLFLNSNVRVLYNRCSVIYLFLASVEKHHKEISLVN